MFALFDDRPGASDAYDSMVDVASRHNETLFGEHFQLAVDGVTKLMMSGLELGLNLRQVEAAWVKIMMEQEKEFGPASPRGCFALNTELDLNHEKARWIPYNTEKDQFFMVKTMLNQLLGEAHRSAAWELRYPVMAKEKKKPTEQWAEGQPREATIRFVMGKAPLLFFADAPLTADLQQKIQTTNLAQQLSAGAVPDLFEKIYPVNQWFDNSILTPGGVPFMAVYLTESNSQSLDLADPRMNIYTLGVHNSGEATQPALPARLGGSFAHALNDGLPVKELLTSVWSSVLAADSQRGVIYPEQGRITRGEEKYQLKPLAVENPFLAVGFQHDGCKAIADMLGQSQQVEKFEFNSAEMKALLEAAKKIGCKVNSLFMLAMLAMSGIAPVTSVAPNEKNFIDKKGKKRRERIQVITLGNKVAYDSPQFAALTQWAQRPGSTTSLNELMASPLFADFPQQLSHDLLNHLAVYEAQINLAQQHEIGTLTYNAQLADKQRANLEAIIGYFSPHIVALTMPLMQFSTLGAEPNLAKGALNWHFESACNKTVTDTVGMLGSQLTLKEFLDNPFGMFDVWQFVFKRNRFLATQILSQLKWGNKYSSRVKNWLKYLAKDTERITSSPNSDLEENAINTAPIKLGGKHFASIHAALAEAGRDSNVLQDAMTFINELLTITAELMQNQTYGQNTKKDFTELLQAHDYKNLMQVVVMTEALAYVMLVQNGQGDSPEATLLAATCNVHKQRNDRLIAAMVQPYSNSRRVQ